MAEGYSDYDFIGPALMKQLREKIAGAIGMKPQAESARLNSRTDATQSSACSGFAPD